MHSFTARFAPIVLALVFSSALSPLCSASEVDNITQRPAQGSPAWSDTTARDVLNAETEKALDGVQLTSCDLRKLHMAVKNALGGGEVGKLEHWAIRENGLRKVTVPYNKSIYAGGGLTTGSGGLFLMGIVPSLLVNGHYFGADKLGHFFDQGYDYYEAIYVRRDPSHSLETLGLEDENDINGMKGNGIRSYGDMAANFSGYLFWRQVAAGSTPYFECRDGKYVRTSRKFDWSEYVNDGWDEGVNCSEYKPSVKKEVDRALGKLGLKCPVEPARCQAIADLACGATFLSPACLPYVQLKSYPDAACAAILRTDAFEAPHCPYRLDPTRLKEVRQLTELVDGAHTVVEMRREQSREYIEQKKSSAFKKMRYVFDLTTRGVFKPYEIPAGK